MTILRDGYQLPWVMDFGKSDIAIDTLDVMMGVYVVSCIYNQYTLRMFNVLCSRDSTSSPRDRTSRIVGTSSNGYRDRSGSIPKWGKISLYPESRINAGPSWNLV